MRPEYRLLVSCLENYKKLAKKAKGNERPMKDFYPILSASVSILEDELIKILKSELNDETCKEIREESREERNITRGE